MPERLWLLLAVAGPGRLSYLALLARRRASYAVRFTNLALLDAVSPPSGRGGGATSRRLLLLLALGGMVGSVRPAGPG
jgi:hypothetical protein